MANTCLTPAARNRRWAECEGRNVTVHALTSDAAAAETTDVSAAVEEAADTRLTLRGPTGTILSWSALAAPPLFLIIWELVAQAASRPLPGTVTAAIVMCLMPGIVFFLRARRCPNASVLGPSTSMMVSYWIVLAIGVPSTWYFSPRTSYFFAYDTALTYLATFMAVKCAIRLVALYVLGSPRDVPPVDTSCVPCWVLFLPQIALFGIIALRISVGAFFYGAHSEFIFTSPYFGPLMMVSQ